jgi:hypothetical protein
MRRCGFDAHRRPVPRPYSHRHGGEDVSASRRPDGHRYVGTVTHIGNEIVTHMTMRLGFVLAGSVVAAATLSACGTTATRHSAAGPATPTVTSSPAAPTTSPTTTSAPDPQVADAHVGVTLNISSGNTAASVTLTRVIDPATGVDGPPTDDNGTPTSDVYVATLLTVKNVGTQSFSGDADDNSVLIGSNGDAYDPGTEDVKGCTNFNRVPSSVTLKAGKTVDGCVVFALPSGITPVKLQYFMDDIFSDSPSTWLLR